VPQTCQHFIYTKTSFSFDLGRRSPKNLPCNKKHLEIVFHFISTMLGAIDNIPTSQVDDETILIHFLATHAK